MGTQWSLQIVTPPPDAAEVVEATLAALIASMSHWEPSSALSRVNAAPVGVWQAIPADLAKVLDAALAIGRLTGGAFDPAAGRLAELWGFGPSGPRAAAPPDGAIAALLDAAGPIERREGAVRRMGDVTLDLSGIAKGHAVDRVANALAARGAQDLLVEIGGEFVGRGIRPDGQPWWVELENPPGLALPPLRVAAHGVAVATSGDYRRFIPAGARRLGHTLDPRTGYPIANGVVSASVVAADCMHADGWATALTVLGPEEGMTVAAREGLAARIVLDSGREVLSPALAVMLG